MQVSPINSAVQKVKVRVTYEPQQFRACSIQCPNCNNWFHPTEIATSKNKIFNYEGDFYGSSFECPICGEKFDPMNNAILDFIECNDVKEVMQDVKQKKVIWE